MKAKKLIALLLCAVMVLSMAACDNTPAETTEPPVETQPVETKPAPTQPEKLPASVDFEDGAYGFVALFEGMANADASTIELVDYNGSKALKVTNGSGKVPYVAIDVWSLLGEAAANVASIQMTMGIENPDGEFNACAGEVKLWDTNGPSKTAYGWSVYLESKNPKVANVTLKNQAFSADVAPIMLVTLNDDTGAKAGAAPANFFIDDIRFLDASGNLIAANTAAVFAGPTGFSGDKDMSNLQYLKANTVALEGMSGISGTAWGQNGVELTDDQKALLVPGSVVEIEYSSMSGDMWLVFPDAPAWTRVEQQTAATNNSKNICQITFEQIAAVLGEDVTQWFVNGSRLQCESSGDWEVYSVKIGMDSGLKHSARKTVWYEGSITGGAWAQAGIDLTQEMIDAMKPGTLIEVAYTTTSATGDLWIVMPDSVNTGWTRVEQQTAACNGSVLQTTFEQLAAACGSENPADWGARMQFESDGDWEVFSVSLVTSTFTATKNNVNLDGFAVTGGAWGQNGMELTDEQKALLVPGSVITVQYTTSSPTGDLWLVFPDAPAWTRVEQQTAACNGSVMQITYEQIAAVLGEDVSQWFANGSRIQCESDGDWEVFSVAIGNAAGAAEAPAEGEGEPVEIPVPEIPAVPAGSVELYTGTTPLSGWQMVTQYNTTVWGGTMDPASFTDGGSFSVYFTGDQVFSVHLCFNGASWVQLDCELANAQDLGNGTYVATFAMSDLLAQYGTDLSALGAVMVYSNSDAAGYAIVTLVTYNPAA